MSQKYLQVYFQLSGIYCVSDTHKIASFRVQLIDTIGAVLFFMSEACAVGAIVCTVLFVDRQRSTMPVEFHNC